MPSTITFPLWVCQTPALSWKGAIRAELLLGRWPLCHTSAPTLSLLQLRSYQHWGDFCLSKDWLKMRSPACRTRCRNQEPIRSTPWAGEQGPSYDFSSLALNFFAKKGAWTEKPLWGVPSSAMRSSRPSWGEQSHPLLPGWPPWQGWFGSISSPQSAQIPWKQPGAPQSCSDPPAGCALQCLYISPCHTGYLPL